MTTIITAIVTALLGFAGAWGVTGTMAKGRKSGQWITRPKPVDLFFLLVFACVIFTAIHSLSMDLGSSQ